MESFLSLATHLGLCLASYALLDVAFRGGLLTSALGKLGLQSKTALTLISCGVLGALVPFWSWGQTPEALRVLATAMAVMLGWNAATRDLDPVVSGKDLWGRAMVLPAAALAYLSPAGLFLTCFLLSGVLRFWLHHATFPMRVLQALGAFALLDLLGRAWPALGFALDLSAFVLFLLILQVSHYFITALAKMLLGPSWHSWMTKNEMHHLAASAYSWGWGRFVPWSTWKKVVASVKLVEKPLQFFAFSLELLAPVAFLHESLAIAFSLLFALFHVGVFAVAGLLFWDWILTDLFLLAFLWALPDGILAGAVGPVPFLLGAVVMLAFPLRHKLWKPMPLGWYDTPLAARIHWEVVGESGEVYEAYNNFMCPHERLYGRVNGCFFVPHPVITYHLGEVWKPELRDGIVEAGPDPEKLNQLRERFGILPHCENRQERHLNYLKAFFCALNRGARKSVLPGWLSFLKAPGDQLFYWGDLKAYRRQEKATQVRLRFVEEYFDGHRLVRLSDQELVRVDIPEEMPAALPEPTPKELDDFLLTHAAGRLIDLPGFRKKYTEVLAET